MPAPKHRDAGRSLSRSAELEETLPPATRPIAGSTTTIQRQRQRQDVVSGASRRAPETDHPCADRRSASAWPSPRSSSKISTPSSCCPLRQMLPAGRDDDLHLPDRSVHAVHPHRADRGAVHLGAAHLLAGVAVRRAGALHEGAAVRDSVRRCCPASGSSAAPRSPTTSRSR